jgi:hydrogenase-4 component H
MLKHTISELKEALVCLEAGRVTLPYPFAPHAPEGEFRGKPVLNTRKCMSCGACGNACPARLISITDEAGVRTLRFELGRCTYCGNCRDACPQEAITLSQQFELSTASTSDLEIRGEFHLQVCRRCGAPIGTLRQVGVIRERLGVVPELQIADSGFLTLCPACRRASFLDNPALAVEVTRERA